MKRMKMKTKLTTWFKMHKSFLLPKAIAFATRESYMFSLLRALSIWFQFVVKPTNKNQHNRQIIRFSISMLSKNSVSNHVYQKDFIRRDKTYFNDFYVSNTTFGCKIYIFGANKNNLQLAKIQYTVGSSNWFNSFLT